MNRQVDIHKAGGVLLKDQQFLIVRPKGKDFFIAPGGKVEAGENVKDALIRELDEELGIEVNKSDLDEFGTFFAPAIGREDKYLQMDVFIVKKWQGQITPMSEVEEVLWVNSTLPSGIELGSIFKHEVLPKLKEKNLIS